MFKFLKKLLESPEVKVHSRADVVKSKQQVTKNSPGRSTNKSNTLINLKVFNDYLSQEECKCPYCLHELGKPATRKRKCPNCKETMYGRTLPISKRKVTVTEKQRNTVDQYNLIVSELDMYGQKYKNQYFEIKSDLTKKWGFEANDPDVFWQLINLYRIDMAKERSWGLYRNATHKMGEILAYEGKLEGALDMYLEVNYMDANGGTNGGTFHNDETDTEYDFSSLAPGIVLRTIDLKEELNLNDSSLKERYLQVATMVMESLNFPIESEKAWEKLEKEINELERGIPTK